MAKKNLVLQACADKAEWFCRLRDFLCALNGPYADYSSLGIGWTLHDSGYAVDADNPGLGDWFVIFSAGENGKEDLYFQISWENNYIKMQGWMYWDAAAHSGTKYYNNSNNMYVGETSAANYELSIYGDLDFIHFWEFLSYSTVQMIYGGCMVDQIHDNTVAICSSPLSAGSDVSIAVDAIPASWYVGQNIYIKDNANIEIITIKTIGAGSITADLVNSYAAGAKLRGDMPYCCSSAISSMRADFLVGHGSITEAAGLDPLPQASLVRQGAPDALNGNRVVAPYYMFSTNTIMGRLPGIHEIDDEGLVNKTAIPGTLYRFYQYYTSFYIAVEEV